MQMMQVLEDIAYYSKRSLKPRVNGRNTDLSENGLVNRRRMYSMKLRILVLVVSRLLLFEIKNTTQKRNKTEIKRETEREIEVCR
jgi:hypothetical protein